MKKCLVYDYTSRGARTITFDDNTPNLKVGKEIRKSINGCSHLLLIVSIEEDNPVVMNVNCGSFSMVIHKDTAERMTLAELTRTIKTIKTAFMDEYSIGKK